MTRSKVIAWLLTFTCFSAGWAQNESHSSRKGDPSIRVDVNLVTINVTVTDQDGRTKNGLVRTDFRLWEDKVEQEILTFDAEDAPTSVGVILDVSGSLKQKISAERQAVAVFLKNTDADDEFFLVKFGDRAWLAQEFTSDIARLQSSLTRTRSYGMTALYNALLSWFGTHQVRTLRTESATVDHRWPR